MEIKKIIVNDIIANKLIALNLNEGNTLEKIIEILKKKYPHLRNKNVALYFKGKEINLKQTIGNFVREYNYNYPARKDYLELKEKKEDKREKYIKMMKEGKVDEAVANILIDLDILSEEIIESAKISANARNISLISSLIENRYIFEKDILTNVSKFLKIPSIDLKGINISNDILTLIPKEVADFYCVIPISRDEKKLVLAMANPYDENKVKEIKKVTGLEIEPNFATEYSIKKMINTIYPKLDIPSEESLPDDFLKPEPPKKKIIIKDGQKLDSKELPLEECEAPTIWANKSDELGPLEIEEDEESLDFQDDKIWNTPTLVAPKTNIPLEDNKIEKEENFPPLEPITFSQENEEEESLQPLFDSSSNLEICEEAPSGDLLGDTDNLLSLGKEISNEIPSLDISDIVESTPPKGTVNSDLLKTEKFEIPNLIKEKRREKKKLEKKEKEEKKKAEIKPEVEVKEPEVGEKGEKKVEVKPKEEKKIEVKEKEEKEVILKPISEVKEEKKVEIKQEEEKKVEVKPKEEKKTETKPVFEVKTKEKEEKKVISKPISEVKEEKKIEIKQEEEKKVEVKPKEERKVEVKTKEKEEKEVISKPISEAKEEKKIEIKEKRKKVTLNRNVSIFYKYRIKPFISFPINIIFSKDKIEIQKKDLFDNSTYISRNIKIEGESAVVKIIPYFPGCLVNIREENINLKDSERIESIIWVTSLNLKEKQQGEIQIWHQNKIIERIEIKFELIKDEIYKTIYKIGIFIPFLAFLSDIYLSIFFNKNLYILKYGLIIGCIFIFFSMIGYILINQDAKKDIKISESHIEIEYEV